MHVNKPGMAAILVNLQNWPLVVIFRNDILRRGYIRQVHTLGMLVLVVFNPQGPSPSGPE